ncbi:MAG: DUF2798 domain-containing protein [Litoricolaceae bacterium]|nr:DUF2798 domain-containing protein [Litorivicinaceae bacterium]
MKLSPQFVGPIVMAFIMALIMIGFVTWMNLGLNDAFFVNWCRAFVFAWPVASIAAFWALPTAPRITLWIVRRMNRIMITPNGFQSALNLIENDITSWVRTLGALR